MGRHLHTGTRAQSTAQHDTHKRDSDG
jgi:hypothetical protein